jgi:transcriptional regulator with PAS, ATPase and Fis domain
MNLEGVDVEWAEELNAAVTVCDTEGIIVYMNRYSIRQFKKRGGEKLLGENLLNCHPEPSKTKLKQMLAQHTEHMSIVEKEGVKTIFLQTPWRVDGLFRGIIEISFVLDPKLPISVG